MKKNIFISLCMVMAVTAVLTSCKKDNDVISLRATISDYRDTGKDGKTYIETINNVDWVSWNDYDKVLINGIQCTVRVSGQGNGRYATINNVAYVTPNENNPSVGYYAVYPAERALTTPTSGFPQILLPQVQVYRNDNPDNPAQGNQIVEAPMAAFCKANSTQVGLNFTNLCALLKIELDEPMEVGYITVSSSNKPLWGKATISGTTTPTLSAPNISDMYSNDNTVTLDCTALGLHHEGSGASQGVNSAGPFYIVLPPATNVADLTINIYVFTGDASGQTRRTILKYSKTTESENTITIAANNLYVTGDLPEEGEVVPDAPFPHLSIGEFSVSRTKKVRFALGNLQYQASTGTWRFAENQWDFVGNGTNGIAGSNASISSTNSNWIDLFGYGTSGAAHNGNTYYPYTHTTNNSNYASGSIGNTNHDWGVNMISNGGNQPNKWRTLTRTELSYLFNSRSNNQRLHYANCQVNGVKGMIILPDNFPYNESPYNNSYNWQWEHLSNDQWAQAEALGAVFMPITGYRNGTTINGLYNNSNSSGKGYYWTSQYYSSWDQAYYLEFDNGDSFHSEEAYLGMAVRLARDVN